MFWLTIPVNLSEGGPAVLLLLILSQTRICLNVLRIRICTLQLSNLEDMKKLEYLKYLKIQLLTFKTSQKKMNKILRFKIEFFSKICVKIYILHSTRNLATIPRLSWFRIIDSKVIAIKICILIYTNIHICIAYIQLILKW